MRFASPDAIREIYYALYDDLHFWDIHVSAEKAEVIDRWLIHNLSSEDYEVVMLGYGLNGGAGFSDNMIALRLAMYTPNVTRRRRDVLDKVRKAGILDDINSPLTEDYILKHFQGDNAVLSEYGLRA